MGDTERGREVQTGESARLPGADPKTWAGKTLLAALVHLRDLAGSGFYEATYRRMILNIEEEARSMCQCGCTLAEHESPYDAPGHCTHRCVPPWRAYS